MTKHIEKPEAKTTFAQLLWERSQQSADRTAFVFRSDREHHHTYASLHRNAAAFAAQLRESTRPRDRVVLLFPPGLDYISAFFGCLYAGRIAVPAYPPQDEQGYSRIERIIADSRPSVVLTAEPPVDLGARGLSTGPRWLVPDDSTAGTDEPPVLADQHDVALLQYTSGSTSSPKGVVVTHANLADNSSVIHRLFATSPESTAMVWLPPYHDMGLVGGILQPIYAGFPCVLMSPVDFMAEPVSWLRAISEHGCSISGGPNFAFDLCVRKTTVEQCAGLDLSTWSLAFCGAEPVRPETLKSFAKAFEPYGFRREALYPCYGLAESTLIATGGRRGEGVRTLDVESQHRVSCGPAIPGHRVTIREPDGVRELPPGSPGEICIQGPSVCAAGYWADPEKSAKTFSSEDGGLLHTGDLGVLVDGELFVTGRLSDVITVRGRNIASEDVEHAVAGCHPQLRPGRIVAFGIDSAEGEALVVLVEVTGGRTDDVADATQAALASTLGVTAERVLLVQRGTVVKTPSGKLRRAECRRRYLAGTLELVPDSGQPISPTMHELTSLAADVLALSPGEVGADTPLTSVGMDSVRAIQLVHAASRRFGAAPTLRNLLSGATCRELELQPVPSSGEETGAGPTDSVTDGEHALWLTSRLSGDPAHNVLTIALDLVDEPDVSALEKSFDLLRQRHSALRTYFPDTDGTPQRRPAPTQLRLEVVDVGDPTDDIVDQRVQEEGARGLDPAVTLPWRAALLQRATRPDVLAIWVHHMACDLWSLDLLADELAVAYDAIRRGSRPDLPPAGDPARIAATRNTALAGPTGERLADFWRRELESQVSPVTFRKPAARLESKGSLRHLLTLPCTVANRIADLAAATNTTKYAVLVTAFAWLVHYRTGEHRFLLGVPTPGRLDPESARAVGYLVNPLPLVCTADPTADFTAHLLRATERLSALLAHQEYPYQRILDDLGGRREPLIHVLLLHRQAPTGRGLDLLGHRRPGLSTAGQGPLLSPRFVTQPNAPFELTVEVADDPVGMSIVFDYDTATLATADVETVADQWARLLTQLTRSPGMRLSDVDLLDESERRLVLHDWNATVDPAPGHRTLHEAVLDVAARDGDAIAVHDAAGDLTYAALDRRSAALAATLAVHQTARLRSVMLLLPRSANLVVAVLAALRAGTPYVPLDPDHPDARLAATAADAGPAVVVTDRTLYDRAPADIPVVLVDDPPASPSPSPTPTHPDWPAYVMYTSGSTGRPKGVVCGHRGVLNLIADTAERIRLGAHDRCGWWTSPGFDISVFEIFTALTAGATVEVCPPEARHETSTFMRWLADRRITIAYVPPHLIADIPNCLAHHRDNLVLRVLVVSVEPIHEPLLRGIMQLVPGLTVLNGYGPTETTIFSTIYQVDPRSPADSATPMGRGVRNCPHYLLNAAGRLVPPGDPGEVYIGGVGLAHGYIGRPAMTAERFVPSPFGNGDRLYRTGDLARYQGRGQLVFIGRLDEQVKVRGVRVEPREVETVVADHPAVAAAVVVVDRTTEVTRLVAFAQVTEARVRDKALAREIIRHVRHRLPSAMVPRQVVLVSQWPTTVNGKIDRSKLPIPRSIGSDYVPPTDDTEAAVATVWAEILDLERVGRDDDFFDLGGDSLLAAQGAAKLSAHLGRHIGPEQIMAHPVVAELAKEIPNMPISADGVARDQIGERTLIDHIQDLPPELCERVLAQFDTDGR